jgi:CHAT domain-containing protein
MHRYAKSHAKNLGGNLFEKLFVRNIQESLVAASNIVSYDHDLKLTFVGPRHSLKLPLEFLYDGTDYLILKHPMKRFVTGIHSRRNKKFSHLLGELQERRERLRILLIASNTIPRIDSVDAEVEAIYRLLSPIQMPFHSHLIVDYLPTEEATYDAVMDRLKGCKYHIMHYAGHGHHDENFPEKSCLYFWEKRNREGKPRPLSVNTLKNTLLMKGHDLQFVYLSCCFGMATSHQDNLVNDNFLGMADGLIMAKVPSVLGFRWPVSDSGARELALTFYESLFDQGDLDTALFNARCQVAGSEEDQNVGDWLSPILIVQG